MKNTYFLLVLLIVTRFCSAGYPILSIVPKSGTVLPTQIITGYDVQAYYTVTNNTNKTLENLYVSRFPINVSQITVGNIYPDACGQFFTLAPGQSCTLELNISGPVQNDNKNYLFISLPGGLTGSGTAYSLQVSQVQWTPLTVSYEIIYTANALSAPNSFMQAYKEAGSNPIDSTEWETYEPPTGYTKNTTRYLQFNESIYITSPGYPNGYTSYIETSDGYTWAEISNVINAMWPYSSLWYPGTQSNPFLAGNVVTTPHAGGVKVSANYKAQLMKFYACENNATPGSVGAVPILRYFIYDQWGNKYIMHASDYSTPEEVTLSFEAAILPEGWTKSPEYLTEDFILYPAQGPNNTYEYNLVRDNQNNTYHQMYWNPEQGITVTSQIQGVGMPIWGGKYNDVLTANNGYNNVMYGGGGANQYYFPALDNQSNPNTGINTIVGFNPVGGDTLNFQGQSYDYIIGATGVIITIGSSGLQVILANVFTFDADWVVNSNS